MRSHERDGCARVTSRFLFLAVRGSRFAQASMGYCSLSVSCHWKKWFESCGCIAGAGWLPDLMEHCLAALGAGLRRDRRCSLLLFISK